MWMYEPMVEWEWIKRFEFHKLAGILTLAWLIEACKKLFKSIISNQYYVKVLQNKFSRWRVFLNVCTEIFLQCRKHYLQQINNQLFTIYYRIAKHFFSFFFMENIIKRNNWHGKQLNWFTSYLSCLHRQNPQVFIPLHFHSTRGSISVK
jgi:hypothetical protein